MQLESLQVFCDVVRLESFSKAAAENHLTQSAVSQIVYQIEKRVGVQLIDRGKRPMKLTPGGQQYFEGCRDIVQAYRALEASIKGLLGEMEATVRVAAIYSVSLGDMGQYIGRFTARNPATEIEIEYLHPDRVYERVLNGSADFGLVSFPKKSRDLTIVPWRDETMVLACPPGHTLARFPALSAAQLSGEPYVAFDDNLVIRRQVDRFLREHDVVVDVRVAFDNVENIKRAIEDSGGIALLPEPTLRREVAAGTLAAVPLTGSRFVRPLGIIHRRQHKLSAKAMSFIELLCQSHPTQPPESNEARSLKREKHTLSRGNNSSGRRRGRSSSRMPNDESNLTPRVSRSVRPA